jgi:hypothetical protein
MVDGNPIIATTIAKETNNNNKGTKKKNKKNNSKYANYEDIPTPPPYQPSETEIRVAEKKKRNEERLKQLGLGNTAVKKKPEKPPVHTVEKFVGHRVANKKIGGWQLKTRWLGWEEKDDTWESIKTKMREYPQLVEAYQALHPELKEPKRKERVSNRISNKEQQQRQPDQMASTSSEVS